MCFVVTSDTGRWVVGSPYTIFLGSYNDARTGAWMVKSGPRTHWSREAIQWLFVMREVAPLIVH